MTVLLKKLACTLVNNIKGNANKTAYSWYYRISYDIYKISTRASLMPLNMQNTQKGRQLLIPMWKCWLKLVRRAAVIG